MPDDKAGGTKICGAAFWVALFALLGLASCGGGGGGGGGVAPVAATLAAPPAITSLAATPLSVLNSDTALIEWTSSDANSCVLSNPQAQAVASATAGSYTTPALTADVTYTLTCSAPGLTSDIQTVIVTVAAAVPTVTFVATPPTITSGASVTLSWVSTNSTTCSSSGGGTGTSGTFNASPVSTTTYTVLCTGSGGAAQQSATVTVAAAPSSPAVTLTATPSTVANGATSSIAWSATNSTSCQFTAGTGAPAGAQLVSGSFTTPSLAGAATYTVSCTGAGGTAQQSATVTVTAAPTPPAVTLTATPPSIAYNATSSIAWSATNSTSCQFTAGTGAPAGAQPVSGSFTTPILTSAATYTVSCTGPGGTAPQSATVTVAAAPSSPAVTLTATPSTIAHNTTSFIAWSATNSTSCQFTAGTGAPVGAQLVSGSFTTPNLTSAATYTVSCTGPGGTAQQSATVTVTPPLPPPVVTVSAAPSSIAVGGTTTITWTSTNSISCNSPGGGGTGSSGTFTTPALNAPTTYTVTCTGSGGTVPGSVLVTVGAAPGCSTTDVTAGATGLITLSNAASRLTGAAPLAVFFDATGTTAAATTRPFHELEYRWDFGDKTGAVLNLSPPVFGTSTWNTGNNPGVNSRNTATGPVAAHVYETPGTYTVALDVTDGTNTVRNSCTEIVVQNPDTVFSGTNTICIGATAIPTAGAGGCPAGATTAMQSNFTSAISTHARTGKRVLFKRGDTFTAPTSAAITSNGPGIVGSFGSGALPIIQMTGNTTTIGVLLPTVGDWRVMDMEFDGMTSRASKGFGSGGGIHQLTILRNTFRNFYTAIGLGAEIPNYVNNLRISQGRPLEAIHAIDELAIIDNTIIYGTNTETSCYNSGNRLAFMGNYVDGGGLQNRYDAQGNQIFDGSGKGSHVLRFPYLGKAVISNNNIERPGFDRLGIKVHAPTWIGSVAGVGGTPASFNTSNPADETYWSNHSPAMSGDGYSKQIVISDNKLTDFINPWSIAVGPQAANVDERVRDVILERNLHVGTPQSQVAQLVRAREVTVRNNLFLGGGAYNVGVRIEVDGPEPPARDVWVYNNTHYSSVALLRRQFVTVEIGYTPNAIRPEWGNANNVPTNITVKNNLAYAPNATEPVLCSPGNDAARNIVVSNNSTDAQVKSGGSAPFVAPPFTVPPVMPLTVPPFTVPLSFLNNFTPTAGSYAINTGAIAPYAPVWSDLLRNSRPQSSVPDIGAVERP